MRTMTVGALSLAATLVTGCGRQDGQERDDESGAPALGSSALLQDADIAGPSIAALIDDATASAAEDQDPEGLSLRGDADGEAHSYRSCNDDGTTAVVDIRRSATRQVTFEGPVRTSETSFAAYHEKQRTWSRQDGEINCDASRRFAALPVRDMQGVSVDIVFKHERSRSSSVTHKKRGTAVSRSHVYEVEGTRRIAWTAVESSDTTVTLTKEITSQATHKLDTTHKDGDKKHLEGSLATSPQGPLVVVVKRDASTLAAQGRIVKSGTLVATGQDGGRLETSFADVEYDTDRGCLPIAGKITGAIFEKDAADPALTYEVSFDGDAQSIVFSNGDEYDYAPEGCELDEPTTATEATEARDVTDPVAGEAPSDKV